MSGYGNKKINVGITFGMGGSGNQSASRGRRPIHVHHHHVNQVYPTIPSAPVVDTSGPSSQEPFTWISTSVHHCDHLLHKAVQAGHEGHDNSPIYVGRANYDGEVVPCKVIPRHRVAYIPYNGREVQVTNIELYCKQTPNVTWVPASYGNIPPGAVAAGHTKSGETLFVGRANHERSITPGKVHGSHRCCYISFGGQEIAKQNYEVLVIKYT